VRSSTRSFIAGAALLACALLLAACGGSKAAQPETALAAAKAEPPPPPLPNNPVRLLPAGARGVLVAVMPELRSSALFDKIEQWAVRSGCLDAARAAWLLERTERVVLASYATPGEVQAAEGSTPALAIFHGKYTGDDVRSALAQSGDWLGAPQAPVQERVRGRFHVIASGEVAGVALSPELLAFGRPADLEGLLDVADGKRPAWLAGDEPRGIDREKWLSNAHSLSLYAQLDETTERRLHRALSNVGAGGAADGLGQSTAAFGVKLGDGARAALQVAYPGSAAAAHAASELRSLLSQASLIIRLAGLPRLDRAEVTSDRELLSVSLALTASEVQQLGDPLLAMIDGEGRACAPRATAEK
jgi:hypothetical protein